MTFASMESSDAVPETENNEILETVESQEIVEQANQNDLATFESAAAVDTGMDFAEAEVVEASFVEVMQAAVTEAPESVAGAADEPGDGPLPPYDPRDDGPGDSSLGIPEPGGDVMIDTVPLPEKPMELGEREMIDTRPTPEEPLRMEGSVPLDVIDRVAIIDSNDGASDIVDKINQATTREVDDSPRVADEQVMIDTVPLPEKPETISSQTAKGAGDEVAIGTWPTPEQPTDEVVDLHEADQLKAGMEDALRDDLRMGEQGYMGEVGLPKGGEIPETGIGDPIGGIDGALDRVPGKVDDPFNSIPEWGETADGQNLEDAAAAGANPLVGSVRSVAGYVWSFVCGSNDTGGSGSAGVRGTPTPDGIEGSFEDPIGGIEINEKTPTDYADSMMQPVDDEGQGREQPGMKMSPEELRDAQLNPYIQNTDEHVDVLPGSRGDMTDPKDFLIDNDLEPFAPGAGGGTNPLAKPSTNDDSPPPPPPGGGKPGVSMDQAGDLVSSKPPDGGDGKPPDGADQVFKPSTNDDAPPPPPPGGGKPGVSMDQAVDLVSSKPPDGGDGKPPDGADLNLVAGLEDSLAPDSAPVDLSGMMDGGTMLNANENKNLKDLDESNAQNLEPGDGKL